MVADSPISAVSGNQAAPPSAEVVRAAVTNTASPEAEGSDNGNIASNAAKKPAWKKPSSNGGGGVDVGTVMDGEVWPSLSASATPRVSPKSISSDSLKTPSQGVGVPSSQKQGIADNTTPGNTPHSGSYTRQKSIKRGGGSSSGGATANGFAQQPSQSGANNSGRAGSAVPGSSSPRDHSQRRGSGTKSHNGNDHSQQRNAFRRGNGGPHPRGDGSSHYRDHGNHDWTSPRSFSSRDAQLHPQGGGSRGVGQPMSPGLSPFMHHPMPIPQLGNPMVYPEVPNSMMYGPEVLRSVPILSPLTQRLMYMPPQLHANILTQIHYYFSDGNLCKDIYLRKNMDDEGWVQIELIAGFKRVRELTDNVQMILDALSSSTEVEVQGDKIRRRNDWKKWIMPPSVQFTSVSSPRSMGNSVHDPLLPNIQNLSLNDTTEGAGTTETFLGSSSSGDLSSSVQSSTGEGTSQDNEKK